MIIDRTMLTIVSNDRKIKYMIDRNESAIDIKLYDIDSLKWG